MQLRAPGVPWKVAGHRVGAELQQRHPSAAVWPGAVESASDEQKLMFL